MKQERVPLQLRQAPGARDSRLAIGGIIQRVRVRNFFLSLLGDFVLQLGEGLTNRLMVIGVDYDTSLASRPT